MKIKSAGEIYNDVHFNYKGDENIVLYSMKKYAQQFIHEAAELVNSWENSGQMREDLLEELNPKNI